MTDVVARWPALGSTAAVRVSDTAALEPARRAVERELHEIDLACSRFRSDSALSQLNSQAGHWTSIDDPLLWEAIDVAVRAAVLTSGLVDPTVGSALVLAGYDRDFAAGLDEPATVVKARRVAGWQTIRLDPPRRRVRIAPGVRLDLGATAKALAADRAATAAHIACGSPVLVNLGGDIATAGNAPEAGWPVYVTDDHRGGADSEGQLIALRTGGIATSSTTVRCWGERSHHIIDPGTSRPVESCWRTVSVAAATCVDANIASTAAILKDRRAEGWLAEAGLPARLVATSGDVVTLAEWPIEAAA